VDVGVAVEKAFGRRLPGEESRPKKRGGKKGFARRTKKHVKSRFAEKEQKGGLACLKRAFFRTLEGRTEGKKKKVR